VAEAADAADLGEGGGGGVDKRGARNADRVGDLLHRVLGTDEHVSSDTELVLGDGCQAAAGGDRGRAAFRPASGAVADELALDSGNHAPQAR
jgi:hypothetical protein